MNSSSCYVIDPPSLKTLFSVLQQRSFRLIGPTIRDNAIVNDELTGVEDLPLGWGDDQGPGTYRLKKRDDNTVFGFNVGPHSWKKFLFPPALKLFAAVRGESGIVFATGPHNGASDGLVQEEGIQASRFAFIGVRPCELHAMFIQDKVFMGGTFVDPHYALLREQAFIVAVNCSQAAATCFCTSMNTGPKADHGFDLCLTEVLDNDVHHFVVQVGSEKGSDAMNELPHREASDNEIEEATRIVERTALSMNRKMDATDIKPMLQQGVDHPRWDIVAERCLSCANCTLVCPTCFCHTIEDTTDLTGDHAERWRTWDSCFTLDFSYIHGGSIRTSRKSRYRQWLTHKLANWIDQFGTSGCVGCGRCITWCPVGIDITEEVHALREHSSGSPTMNKTEVNRHGVA